GVHLAQEFRIGDVARHAALLRRLEQIEERDQENGDDRPEREISVVRVHRASRWLPEECPCRARLSDFVNMASNIGSPPGLAKRGGLFQLSSRGFVFLTGREDEGRRAGEIVERRGET